MSLLRIYQKRAFEGFAAKQHATGHILTVDEAEFDGLDLRGNFDASFDEIAFMLLAVAGADVSLMGDGGCNSLREIAVIAMERDVELDAFAGQLFDVLNIDG